MNIYKKEKEINNISYDLKEKRFEKKKKKFKLKKIEKAEEKEFNEFKIYIQR